MHAFDREDIALRLEAMKLSQGSLQQIMTLSAGGLVLYFSFISKAPLVVFRGFGIAVVAFWIITLCAAVLAHRMHAYLFIGLQRLSDATVRLQKVLGDFPHDLKRKLASAADRESVADTAQKLLDAEHESFTAACRHFERSFFPTQKKTLWLVDLSMLTFVSGFITLGIGYVISALAV